MTPDREPDPGFTRSAVANMPLPLLVVSRTGTLSYVNRAFVEAYGADATDEAFREAQVLDFIHHDDIAVLAESLEYARSHPTTELLPLVIRVVVGDGTTRSVEVVSRNALDDPDIEGLLVNLADVSDRVLLDETLESIAENRKLERTFALLADYLRIATTSRAVIRWSLDGRPPLATDGSISPGTATDRRPDLLLAQHAELWHRAHDRDGVLVPVDELPEPGREAALAEGYRGLWIVSVPFVGESPLEAHLGMWLTDDTLSPGRAQSISRAVGLVRLALERHHAEVRLRYAARHDPLTGLANRTEFFAQLDEHLHTDSGTIGVLYLDLDGFKAVNDAEGHAAGDAVLRVVARRIGATVRPADLVARLGGDELAVLCPHLGDIREAERIADRLIDAVGEPISVEGRSVRVGLSIGISSERSPTAADPDGLVRSADAALYRAKTGGRNTWRRAP